MNVHPSPQKSTSHRWIPAYLCLFLAIQILTVWSAPTTDPLSRIRQTGISRGICVLLDDRRCENALKLARQSDLTIYVQLRDRQEVLPARRAAEEAGFYEPRIYVEKGSADTIHLADELADIVFDFTPPGAYPSKELLRILHPGGKAFRADGELSKPTPAGVDDWSHPYHGPDNNPLSQDRLAREPYLTQFLANPRYGPVPQIAVASAGRVFKAFGHVAWHLREEAYLNKLVAFNGYNGTLLWTRDLQPGYMIHRNTIIAAPDTLYLADDRSCKLIDTATGKLRDEIIPSEKITGGTFWKWMALEDGVLYAMIGPQEQKDPTQKWRRLQHGWPWNQISKGFTQAENPWGFGRTMIALNPQTKKILWHYHEDHLIDSRAVCMKNGRIFLFGYQGLNQPGAFLTCLNTRTGKPHWRKTPQTDEHLFKSIGKYLNRQDWRTNWRTTTFTKCSDQALYFAGPQVEKLLAVSAEDGRLLWENDYNNYQLILREDGLYGLSGQIDNYPSRKFDPLTGAELTQFETARRACTRPTSAVDAIFYRAQGGTTRLDVAAGRPHWISPMRPACHDGVTIANGLLYWWPFVCDCQLTLYGITCLAPAGNFAFNAPAHERRRLEIPAAASTDVKNLTLSPADWPTFRADNIGSATSRTTVPLSARLLWQYNPKGKITPTLTAPVAVGNLVFIGGFDGLIRAFDAATGRPRWKAYTGGAVRLPPTIWRGRALVGAADGKAYAFEAQSGRPLWSFRAAPIERKIPVYGALMSNWPVTSGILAEDGAAYLAAGIANYDGTHVYALDAETGRIKWQNNTSGHLDPQARTGVSVQGHLLFHDNKLYLAGGNAVSPAIYDAASGKCLNDLRSLQVKANNKVITSISPRGWELFLIGDHVVVSGQPYYGHPDHPVYDPSVTNKMLVSSMSDRHLIWVNNQKLLCYPKIDRDTLNRCIEPERGLGHMIKPWGKLKISQKPQWQFPCEDSAALAIAQNAVVIAQKNRLTALDLSNGKPLWSHPLPAAPLTWGLALDRQGRALVSLKNGQLLCFGSDTQLVAK